MELRHIYLQVLRLPHVSIIPPIILSHFYPNTTFIGRTSGRRFETLKTTLFRILDSTGRRVFVVVWPSKCVSISYISTGQANLGTRRGRTDLIRRAWSVVCSMWVMLLERIWAATRRYFRCWLNIEVIFRSLAVDICKREYSFGVCSAKPRWISWHEVRLGQEDPLVGHSTNPAH